MHANCRARMHVPATPSRHSSMCSTKQIRRGCILLTLAMVSSRIGWNYKRGRMLLLKQQVSSEASLHTVTSSGLYVLILITLIRRCDHLNFYIDPSYLVEALSCGLTIINTKLDLNYSTKHGLVVLSLLLNYTNLPTNRKILL